MNEQDRKHLEKIKNYMNTTGVISLPPASGDDMIRWLIDKLEEASREIVSLKEGEVTCPFCGGDGKVELHRSGKIKEVER